MCGIAGIVSEKSGELKAVNDLVDSLDHRGPDDSGVWIGDKAALGHTRLSILDLSDAGHQPFISEDNRFSLTYNGEIYNYLELRKSLEAKGYLFTSNTDTEVLLKCYIEYGQECLQMFNGMFAFAIWDKNKKELFAARDHFGIKPFYYSTSSESLVFASEAKVLLKSPNVSKLPDDQSIYEYLLYSLVDHSERTFFEDIKQLPPAHCLEFKDGKLKVKRWWDLDFNTKFQGSFDEKKEKLFSLIEESTKIRLRSDVPVSCSLSGGIDSTAIAALMRRQNPGTITAFNAVYGEKECDETEYVKETCEEYNLSLKERKLNSDSLILGLSELVKIQGEPFQSTSHYAQWEVMKACREAKFKVILSGQGADECLAGYDIYLSSLAGQYLSKFKIDKFLNLKNSIKKFRNQGTLSVLASYRHTKLYNSKFIDKAYSLTKQPSFLQTGKPFTKEKSFKRFWQTPYKSFLKNHMYNMLFHNNLPALLRYEDRNSMSQSIESRVPFLDPNLVQFCYSLNEEDYIQSADQTKYIMREALKGRVTESVRTRTDKMGFPTPEQKWFKELQPFIESIFNSDTFKSRKYFDHGQVNFLYQNYISGQKFRKFPLWRVLNLELWLREFVD